MYLCRLYTVFTWICKNIVALLRHVEHGVELQSCQSEVIHGTHLCGYCGPL
jgi:hypothetical protein